MAEPRKPRATRKRDSETGEPVARPPSGQDPTIAKGAPAEGAEIDDTAPFEASLRARYRELWQDVQREIEKQRGEQFPDLVDRGDDPEDEAVADLIVDLDIAEIERDIDEMRAIHHAIGRIKRGTYGVCAACGEPIAAERLEALPQAVLCLDCQARNERSRGSTPSL